MGTVTKIFFPSSQQPSVVSKIPSSLFLFPDDDDSTLQLSSPIQEDQDSRFKNFVPKNWESVVMSGASIEEQKPFNFIKEACLAILDDCVKGLEVTQSIKPEEIPCEEEDDEYQSLEDRFGFLQRDYHKFRIGDCYTSHQKIQKVLQTAIVILRDLQDEINVFGSFKTLGGHADFYKKMKIDTQELLTDYDSKQKVYENLKKAYSKIKKDAYLHAKELDEELAKVAAMWRDGIEYGKAEKIYAENHQRARSEQNSIRLQKQETNHRHEIWQQAEYQRLETFAHLDLMNYLEESRNDLQDQIMQIMERYDIEFDKRELEIYNLQSKIDRMIDEKGALKDEIDRRQQEMDEILQVKVERKNRQVLEDWAAKKIQVFWRGILLGRKFNALDKKSKPSKKGKKGKKIA